jgi:hypothetical protein
MKSALSAIVAPTAVKVAPRLQHVPPGVAAVLLFGALVVGSMWPFLAPHGSNYEFIALILSGALWGGTASVVSAELFSAEVQALLGGAAIQSAVAHFAQDVKWLADQIVLITSIVIAVPALSHDLDLDIRRIVGSSCVAFIVLTLLNMYFQHYARPQD